jgi:Ca2+-transporting ATPase
LGISLAVSIIPEGLPTTATIVLAISVQKMAKKNVLVKDLASVETLGSVDVICSDKTGTLTQNKMIIKELYAGLEKVNEKDYQRHHELIMGGVYCNNAFLEDDGNLLGDPTEGAFLLFADQVIPE